MMPLPIRPGRPARRSRFRPSPEALESRLALASAAMTIGLDPAADAMIGGIATSHVLTLDGHASPHASIRVEVGAASRSTRADGSGNFKVALPMAEGTYPVTARALGKAGPASEATMSATMGDAVLAWDSTMIRVLEADTGNVGLVSRTMAMVSGAVYDAVNAIDHVGSTYKVAVKAPKGASAPAAASEAADAVLSALDPNEQSLLGVTMAQSLAAIPAGKARDAGIAVGLQAAEGILAWRADDGSNVSVPYVPGTAPGRWRPTPPTYAVAWGPEWGAVSPFGITEPASAFLPPPPPALNSPEYAAALDQVESLGALDSTTRTADQTEAGLFWAYDSLNTGTPPVHYEQIAATLALQEHNTLARNARMFGLVNVAMGDAGIAAWDAKYTYDLWRPVTAIRLADADGNPATVADPTWTPLGSPGAPGQPSFTPPFPGYVSGHATFGAALFTTLADFYGTDAVRFTIGSDQTPGVTRSYSSFGQASLENAQSRVYLGVHFWFDETEGLTMGASIAEDVVHHVMTPSKHA